MESELQQERHCSQNRLRDFGDVRSLWSFLAFSDLELDLIAFLKALISFRADRAVVHEHIWAICATDEPIAFGVIEPLDGSFQTFHEISPSCHVLGGEDVSHL